MCKVARGGWCEWIRYSGVGVCCKVMVYYFFKYTSDDACIKPQTSVIDRHMSLIGGQHRDAVGEGIDLVFELVEITVNMEPSSGCSEGHSAVLTAALVSGGGIL